MPYDGFRIHYLFGRAGEAHGANRRKMQVGHRLERENIHDQIRFAIQQNDVAAD
jgi:hypothetical protein